MAGELKALQMEGGAALAALLGSTLGGAATVIKTYVGTTTLLAAHATKARAVLVFVTINETYADAGGTQPTVKIGETDTIEKGIAAATIAAKTAGTFLGAAFTNTATKAIVLTGVAAIGAGTGGLTVTVIALPTT